MKQRQRRAGPIAKDVATARPAAKKNISESAFIEAMGAARSPNVTSEQTWSFPKPHPGVVPEGMAMDSTFQSSYSWAMQNAVFAEGQAFLGYTYLAELTQRAEYRRPAEILAKQMTRKWIKLRATGDEDSEKKAEKIAKLEAEMKRLKVQAVFRKAVELDGFFGRAQIYIDVGAGLEDRDEINKPLAMTSTKVPKGGLKRLTVVEPMWTYPANYNATNPLAPNFYRPTSWYVMGSEVHASRLLTITGRPVPDILKPAYMFGGLSLSQMAKPYVDNWLRTRQSVSDLIHAFSVMVFKTKMDDILTGGSAQNFIKRVQMFNAYRDNKGVFAVDKDTEDLTNVAAPISGLDSMQAASQEQMSAVTGIPLSILLGITPHGLNASNDGEIRAFYDWVEAEQESKLSPALQTVLEVIQLSLFGDVDPDIVFQWEPLWSMSAKEVAEIDKTKAEADSIRVNDGIISPHEARVRLAKDEESPYSSLDLDDDPIVPPDDDEDEVNAALAGTTGGQQT